MSETVQEFINVVQRSHLIPQAQLMQVVQACTSADGELPTDPKVIAGQLRRRGLISEWQEINLLKGKSRGFFLGNYRLLGHLGSGGMSSVFLAQHELMDRKVAIKVLPSSKEKDQSFLDRFEREALATSKLSHPNVVRVFDIETENSTHYIVMEYVSGRDLKAIVADQGPLPLEQVADYIAQTAAGLQHAHERGLVHRDIKPANLVVNEMGLVKVLDLGLAKLQNDDDLASLTVANSESMMGTADYLAPEQARNAHGVDHRADIYGLGCTFYFLLTGHPPFTEGTIAERILKHQTARPSDVRAERADCPHALADVCMTMLEKDPENRFESCGKVVQRLAHWLMSKGYPIASTLSGFTTHVYAIPVLPTSNEVVEANDIPVAEPSDSLLESRKSRTYRSKRAPLGLWIFLAFSVLICIGLLIAVLLRNQS